MGEQLPLSEISAAIAPKLVSFHSWDDASFISLPIVYPSGSFVSVCLSYCRDGIRVSDAGFAFREVDSFGAGRSFRRTASSIAEEYELSVGKEAIYVDVSLEEVERAIFDVSAASHATADRIVSKLSFDSEINISEKLHERLDRLFPDTVQYEGKIVGASSTEWEVSAITKEESRSAVFQIVTNYPVAVYKASTAFHDIAALDRPPSLVSVVVSKQDMGKNYSILAQAGRVIEIGQSDDVYQRAAA